MKFKQMIEEYGIPFIVKENNEVVPIICGAFYKGDSGKEYATYYSDNELIPRYMCLCDFSETKTANLPANKTILEIGGRL